MGSNVENGHPFRQLLRAGVDDACFSEYFTSPLRSGLVKYEMAYSALVIWKSFQWVVSRYFNRKLETRAFRKLSDEESK